MPSQSSYGVDLSAGHVAFPLSLITAPGKNGLDIEVNISYTSANYQHVQTWNQDHTTGILGLGWSLPLTSIVRDTLGTGSTQDDRFFLLTEGANQLIQIDQDEAHLFYACQNYQFWRIFYTPSAEQWTVIQEDGTTILLGGDVTTDHLGHKQSQGNAIEWGVKQGNWVGSSQQVQNQSQFALAWNLTNMIDSSGQTISFTYTQIQKPVGNMSGLPYTQANYLSSISALTGNEVTFHYAEKDPEEYSLPLSLPDAPEIYQQRLQTRYLSGLELHNEYGTLLYTTTLTYAFLNTGQMKKRLLTEIRVLNPQGKLYEPPSLFTYYGQEHIDGVSVSLSDNSQIFNAQTQALYGALKSMTTPAGEVTSYKYTHVTLETTERALKQITGPDSTWGQPQITFAPNYTIVIWQKGTQIALSVYQWQGNWSVYNGGIFSIGAGKAKVVAGEAFFAVITPGVAQSLHLFQRNAVRPGEWLPANQTVVLSADTQALAGENFLVLLDGRRLYRYQWKESEKLWVQPDTNPTLLPYNQAGANHALQGRGKYFFVVSTPDRVLDKQAKPEIRLSVLLANGLWQDKIQTIDWFLPDPSTIPDAETAVGGSARRLQLYAGNTFVSLQSYGIYLYTVGENAYNQYHSATVLFQWGEDLAQTSDITHQILYTNQSTLEDDLKSEGCTVIGDLIAVVSQQRKLLYRYNGQQWNQRILSMEDQTNFYGDDITLEVTNRGGTKHTSLQQYNPQNDTWETQFSFEGIDIHFYQTLLDILGSLTISLATTPFGFLESIFLGGLLESLLANGPSLAGGWSRRDIAGFRTMTITNRLYYQNANRSWSLLPDDLLNGEQDRKLVYDLLTLSDRFIAFMTTYQENIPQPGFNEFRYKNFRNWVWLLRNGQIVKKLTLETPDEQARNEASLTTEPSREQPWLIGSDTIVAYPRQHGSPCGDTYDRNSPPCASNFKDTSSFHLYHLIDDAIEGSLSSYAVGEVSSFDGFQTITTFIEYDTKLLAFSAFTAAPIYNKVTVSTGINMQEAKQNGWSEFYFYTGEAQSLPYAPTDRTWTNADDYPAIVAGQLYHIRAYKGDLSSPPIMMQTTYWHVFTQGLPNGEMGYFLKPLKEVESIDGVEKSMEYTYDIPAHGTDPNIHSGMVTTERTRSYDALGQEVLIELSYLYGWRVYSALWDKHIMDQVIQTTTTRYEPSTALQGVVEHVFVVTWKQWSNNIWAPWSTFEWSGTGQPNFTAWNQPDTSSDWLRISEILLIKDGLPIEIRDAQGTITSSLYDKNNLFPIAQFVNASNSHFEAFYTAFERYEDLREWRIQGETIDTSLHTQDSYTGETCLFLAEHTSASIHDDTLRVPLSLEAQQRTFVLSASIKTQSGFGTDPGEASLGLVVYNQNQNQRQIVTLALPDTGNRWTNCELVVDLSQIRSQYHWATDDLLALGIVIENAKISHSLLADTVRLSPLDALVTLQTYDADYRLVTATLDANGLQSRTIYNRLQREIGRVGPDEQVSNVLVSYRSREGNAGQSFQATDPNSMLSLTARSGGTYYHFRGEDAGGWTGGIAVNDMLILRGDEEATLPLSNQQYGLRLQVDTNFSAPDLKWRAIVPKELGQLHTSVAISTNGVIYAGTVSGFLVAFAVNKPDAPLWNIQITKHDEGEGSYIYCLVASDQTIYATDAAFGTITAITPNGARKWTYTNPDGGSIAPPVIGSDGILYTADDLALHAIHPANGSEIWKFPFPQILDRHGSVSTVAIGPDKTIYVGMGGLQAVPKGLLYAILPNRQAKWAGPLQTEGGIVSPPAIAANGTIYVTTQNGKLYALRADSSQLWPQPLQFNANIANMTPIVGRSNTIYVTDDTNVYALNSDGSFKWQYVVDSHIVTQLALDQSENSYLCFDDGYTSGVLALRADGFPLWTAPFSASDREEGLIAAGPIIGQDGLIYVNSAPGQFIYALQLNGENAVGKSIGVSCGSTTVKYQSGAYSLYDGTQQINGPLVMPLATDWLLLAFNQTILFYADGQQLFATTSLNQSVHDSLRLSAQGDDNSGVAFHDLFVFQDPISVMTYLDGAAQVRQQQMLETASSVLLSEALYDARGKVAFTTVPVRKQGNSHAVLFGFEPDFVEGRDPASGNALWDRTFTHPQHGVMRGRIQDWLDAQFKTDYPYAGQTYQPDPLARPSEETAPEAHFISGSGHTIQHTYGMNETAQSYMSAVGIPTSAMSQYHVRSKALPLNDTQRILSVSVQNTAGQNILEGATDQRSLRLFASAWTYQPNELFPQGGLTKVTSFPNAFVHSESRQAFQAVTYYDHRGLPVRQKMVDTATDTQSIYDLAGRPRFLFDATGAEEGHVLYTKYDALGRQIEAGYINMGWDRAVLQGYANRQPEWPTTGIPLQHSSYDRYETGESTNTRGRLVQVIAQNSAPDDRLTSIKTRFTYDRYGNQTSVSTTVADYNDQEKITKYTYDLPGNITSITYPSLTEKQPELVVTYSYDLSGRIVSIGKAGEGNQAAFATYRYNADGSLNQEILNAQAETSKRTVLTYSYNSLGWLTALTGSRFMTEQLLYQDKDKQYLSGNITSTNYIFDSLVYVGEKQAIGYRYEYEYDGFQQLVEARHSEDSGLTLTIGRRGETGYLEGGYDANGNILHWQAGESIREYRYTSNTNQLASIFDERGAQEFTYTANGAVQSTPTLGKLHYDPLRRRVRLALPPDQTTLMSYQYSGNNEQTLKIVWKPDSQNNWQPEEQTLTLHGGGDLPLVEARGTSERPISSMRYIYGPNGLLAMQDEKAIEYFVLKDHLGSTRVVFTGENTVAAFFNYSPFGNLLENNSTGDTDAQRFTHRYTGQAYDFDLGLYNYRARLYDSSIGRFYSPDPSQQSASPYAYVDNNPTNRIDPTGEVWWPSGRTIARVVTAAGTALTAGVYYALRSLGVGRLFSSTNASIVFFGSMVLGSAIVRRRFSRSLSQIISRPMTPVGNPNHPLIIHAPGDKQLKDMSYLLASWRGIDPNNVIEWGQLASNKLYNRHVILNMHGLGNELKPEEYGTKLSFLKGQIEVDAELLGYALLNKMKVFNRGETDKWFIENIICYGSRPGAINPLLVDYLKEKGVNVTVKGSTHEMIIYGTTSSLFPMGGAVGPSRGWTSGKWVQNFLEYLGITAQGEYRYHPPRMTPGWLRALLLDNPIE